jgi:hypothetical protein
MRNFAQHSRGQTKTEPSPESPKILPDIVRVELRDEGQRVVAHIAAGHVGSLHPRREAADFAARALLVVIAIAVVVGFVLDVSGICVVARFTSCSTCRHPSGTLCPSSLRLRHRRVCCCR